MANKPDGTGATNTTPGTYVDAPCKPNLVVTYRINSGCGSIPYAVELNGKVLDHFKDFAPGVACNGKSEIRSPVKPGDRIALYLNSDAHPDYRKEKVYGVTVGSNDIVVTITEKAGKHADSDTPTLSETKAIKNAKGQERQTDFYTAPLTGDIWLQISHKYTSAEIDKILPATTDKAISAAVKKFYDGTLSKTANTITIDRPSHGDAPATQTSILIGSGSDGNPLANIQAFDLFKDGLPRVHPLGYLVLIDAALESKVGKLTLSSTWRPLLGSIAHRAGLGLDVNWIENTHLNREELRGKGPEDGNVSADEKEKFKEKEQAEKEATTAQEKLRELQKERDDLISLKKSNPNKANPIREAELKVELETANTELDAANRRAGKAKGEWNFERDKNEPKKVKGYRASLAKCEAVRQIFDPWFMDIDSRDPHPATPNEQRPNPPGKKGPSIEELHATHLHITVNEPRLKLGQS